MADEQNPNNQPPAPPAAPVTQPAPSAPAITPEVQALIDAARNEERVKTQNATWAEARRKYEKQSDPPKQPPSEQTAATSQALSPESVKQMIATESAIARGVALHGYSATQEAHLRTLIEASKPPDVPAFIAEMTAVFGITPKPATTATPQAAPPATTTAPPARTAPAPSIAVPGDGPESTLKLSMSQISDLLIKNGAPFPANPMHPANAPFLGDLHKRLDAEMARIRLTPARR